MMLIGVLWAAFAPLILLLAIVALALALKRFGVARAWVLAAALVLLPVAGVYWSERRAFAVLCDELGPPVIREKARADGILLVSGTSNSFGMRYLHEEGFAWMELRDVTRRDGWARAARDDKGQIALTPIDAPTARYEVRETHEQRDGAGIQTTQVFDRQTGVEMARGANANFSGGLTKWALGAWGAASCPSAYSSPEGFNAWYHLGRNTLR